MRHPYWILNSTLLFLFLITVGITIVTKQTVPDIDRINTRPIYKPRKTTVSKIAIEKIYERDPFGTVARRIETVERPVEEKLALLPTPPSPQPIEIPQKETVEFLDPIGVTLKGIMAFALDETKNRAIIADNKTNVETMYRVGDRIEDAQLLRIYSNKVLFIRSNGQQEIVYLREEDALNDPIFAMVLGWDDCIIPVTDHYYTVDPEIFVSRIGNLGQFIDLLDLTTVYKKGTIIGCRIGIVQSNSLAASLGLRQGDIITMINDIPATSTSNRLAIYRAVTSSKPGDSIRVTFMRNGQQMTNEYKLQAASLPKKHETIIEQRKKEAEQLNILQKKHTLAPTMQEIRLKEKQYMKEQGKRPFAPMIRPSE